MNLPTNFRRNDNDASVPNSMTLLLLSFFFFKKIGANYFSTFSLTLSLFPFIIILFLIIGVHGSKRSNTRDKHEPYKVFYF